jgi:DnaJ-class molecular chaperone
MNHYQRLGIDQTATADDVKRAYRRLAKEHHPDVGGNSETFRQITEAYEVLSDPNNRAQYDNPQPQGFRASDFRSEQEFQDIFADLWKQKYQKNRDINIAANITLADVIVGKEMIAVYRLHSGREESVTINIPPGANDGSVVRFGGFGDDSIKGAYRGDLYVKIKVVGQQDWKREGDDLHTVLRVNALDMITGTEAVIKTLDNKSVKLNIPQGTKNNTKFAITDYGVPNAKTLKRGKLIVRVEAEIPHTTSEKILEKLRNIRSKL